MGHYTELYDQDANEAYQKEKADIISEIEYDLIDKGLKELKLIRRVVKNVDTIRNTIKVFKI